MSNAHYTNKKWIEERLWAWNIARQFMQSLKGNNPLRYREVYYSSAYLKGVYDPLLFSRIYRPSAHQHLVKNLSSEKISRLAYVAPGGNKSGVTPISFVALEPSFKITSGEDLILDIATLSLVAVCFDLCQMKHPVS